MRCGCTCVVCGVGEFDVHVGNKSAVCVALPSSVSEHAATAPTGSIVELVAHEEEILELTRQGILNLESHSRPAGHPKVLPQFKPTLQSGSC